MMKFVDYRTDLFNGLVDMEIPLYTIVDGDISLPISVSYHASGLKVKEKTGKIGLGWALKAEPSVTRAVRGKADDRGGYLSLSNLQQGQGPPYYYDEQVAKGAYDLEPDAFYYQLAEKSGKFYFSRNVSSASPTNQIVVHPYEPIKIVPGSTSFISSFSITDDDGLLYTFGAGLGIVDQITTQWQVSGITSPNGRGELSFSYGSPVTVYDLYNSRLNPYYIAVEELLQGSIYGSSVFSLPCYGLNWPFISQFGAQDGYTAHNIIGRTDLVPTQENGNLIVEAQRGTSLSGYQCGPITYQDNPAPVATNQYIQTIESRTVTVSFFYDPNSEDRELLKRIEVRNKLDNQIIRKVYFTQTPYFFSDGTRLKLDEVRITDKDDTLIERYRLEYNNETLPSRTASGADHWGFANRIAGGYPTEVPQQRIRVFNSEPTNLSWLPEYFTLDIGDADKTPNDIVQAGILKSITYPTGRRTSFYYESNKYHHDNVQQAYLEERVLPPGTPPSEVRSAGGLRIARIEELDPVSGKKHLRSFSYGKDENGVGHVAHQPSLKDYMYEYNMANGTGATIEYTGYRMSRVRMYVPNPLAEMSFDGGSPVVYEEVAEYLSTVPSNGQATLDGKNVYKYGYANPFLEHVGGTTLNRSSDDGWSQGRLWEKTSYKIDSYGRTLPVMRDTYTYSAFRTQQLGYYKVYSVLQGRGTNDLPLFKTTRDNYGAFSVLYGSISTGCLRPVSQQNEVFNENGRVVRTTVSTYGNTDHLFATKVETRQAGLTVKTEEYQYPSDISSPGPGEQLLVAGNQLRLPLVKKTSMGGRVWVNRTQYAISSNIAVPSAVWSGVAGNEEKRVDIVQSDAYGNPLEVRSDGATTIYLWGYYGTSLMAEIRGASYAQVAAALGTDPRTVSGSTVPGSYLGPLRGGLSNAQISSYTYTPLVGISSSTDPSGLTTYYGYDRAGRLKETYIMEDGDKKIVESVLYNLVNP